MATPDEQKQRESIHSQIHHLGELTLALERLFEDLDGEVTEATDHLEAFLDSHTDDTIEAVVWYLKELAGTQAIVKDELDRLQAVKARTTKREAWAKGLIRDLFQRRGVRKVTAGTFTISLRKAPARLVGDAEPALLDDRFVREIPARREVDKPAIKEALKAGEVVDGFRMERGPDGVVVK